MERYDKYYGGSPEIPPVQVAPLKTAIFKVIPEVGSRVSALLANEVQIISTVPPTWSNSSGRIPGWMS